MFEKILEAVKNKTPLVHSITNYVTVTIVPTLSWRAEEHRSCQMIFLRLKR